jgi:ferredoxin-type protein NapF
MPTYTISRLQFLRGDFRGKRHPLRPPWFGSETDFIDHCERCGECVKACPENILEKGRGGYPQVNFQQGECTFCGRCADQCPNDTLQKARTPAWTIKAHIENHCLTQQDVICFSCRDNCESEAIYFNSTIAKVPVPKVHIDECNGCGACYQACPVSAIIIK